LPEFALKLSGLARLSALWEGMAKTRQTNLAIVKEDMDWAISKVNKHYEHFKSMIRDWKRYGQSKPYRTDEETMNEAIRILEENNGKMQWTKLSRELKIYGRKFHELIDGWRDAGIMVMKVETSEEGRLGISTRSNGVNLNLGIYNLFTDLISYDVNLTKRDRYTRFRFSGMMSRLELHGGTVGALGFSRTCFLSLRGWDSFMALHCSCPNPCSGQR